MISDEQPLPRAGGPLPAGAPRKARWLLRRPDPAAEARLFCFPYSGCGATMYQRWPRWIGRVEVCPVQPPARQNRITEPHYGSYEELAAAFIDYLRPYLDKPFGFFGHCGGALPGVEVTYQLDAAGLPPPRRLFVSSQVAPHDGPYGELLDLSTEQLGDLLRQIITNLGGEPAGAVIEMGLELLVQDIEANKRYLVPQVRPLPCGVTAIAWREDSMIPIDLMGGWRALTPDCRSVVLDGGHFEFIDAPTALLGEFEHDLAPTR